jgi:TPR repeat protein
MAEQTTPYRPYDPDSETYDIEPYRQDTANQVAPYNFGRSGRAFPSNDSLPLFISDYDGEPDPGEYMPAPRTRRGMGLSSRILAAVVAAAAVAVLFAAFSADATRDIIVSAKASIAAAMPAPSAAAQPDAAKLTARDIQLKDPARVTAPSATTMGGARAMATVAVAAPVAVTAVAATPAAAAPSRVEIASAYQSALQSRPPVATAPIKSIDPDTMAAMMKRAMSLLEAGDIPPARLLLERAADAQEASAAFLLAQTYDPAVLGTPDMRSIAADPAAARGWYEKAAQLGSADAQARLSQMQN